VAAGKDDAISPYLDALDRELAGLETPQPVETLFLGGGTPTHLSARQLDRLLTMVCRWLPLQPGHEFSVEANPGTLDQEKIAVLAAHSVNRVSLGAQSFQPELLRVLERDHRAEDICLAVERLKNCVEQVSLDLIFGVPGQSLADWRGDLTRALALEPSHISTYGLTYEKGTRLWKQRRQGQVQPLTEDTELAMYLMAMDTLEAAGFEHYEISNFARPSQRCRHNQVYWANQAYFGFGVGAARYVQGRRELNTRDLTTYLRRMQSGVSPTFQAETLGPEDRARETIGLNLRRAEGVQRRRFREQTGFEFDGLAGAKFCDLIASGHLVDDATGVRLTQQGKCVADAVIEQFWTKPEC
jgi:oxygen-independent coproporphyrinogen-3 oxidase